MTSDSQWQSEPLNMGEIDTVAFNGVTTQTARGMENKVYQRQSSDGGTTWSNWQYISMHSQEATPRTFVLGDRVVQLVHNPNTQVYARWTDNGQNWSGWGSVGGGVAELETEIVDDRLVLLQQNTNERVYSRTVDGDKRWTNWELAPARTHHAVEQDVIDGRIVQSYRGVDDLLHTRHSIDGLEWTDWTPIAEALATSQWQQENVASIKADIDATDSSLSEVTRLSFQGKEIEAVRAENNRLHMRHSTDGGTTWTPWEYAHGNANGNRPVVKHRVWH